MPWDDIEVEKPTEKQIKYATLLLEALYGEVNQDLKKLSKREISALIDESKRNMERLGLTLGVPESHGTTRRKRKAETTIWGHHGDPPEEEYEERTAPSGMNLWEQGHWTPVYERQMGRSTDYILFNESFGHTHDMRIPPRRVPENRVTVNNSEVAPFVQAFSQRLFEDLRTELSSVIREPDFGVEIEDIRVHTGMYDMRIHIRHADPSIRDRMYGFGVERALLFGTNYSEMSRFLRMHSERIAREYAEYRRRGDRHDDSPTIYPEFI